VAAFTASAGLRRIYLPAGRYPCNPFLLPKFPIYFYGDGKASSVLKFPQSITYAVSYDNTSTGKVQVGSPFYTTGSDGKSSSRNNAWTIAGIGFEGGDWSGSATTNAGLDFPNWASGDRNSLKLTMYDVGIGLFQGNGIRYEINGLYGDSVFDDLEVFANSGDGVVPGSDQRWKNLLSHDNGGWGVRASDHRNTQFIGGKAYGNGQVGHLAGGYYIRGNLTLMNNLYAQDNNGPGFWFDTATLVQAGQLFADRNCVNSGDASGMIINNCNGIIIDGYGATDTQRTTQAHALKVTGTNTQGVVRLNQVQTNLGLGTSVESNSGGVTVYSPVSGVSTDTLWDTKGDLAVATAADTASKLAVGTDGQVLTADSAQTVGVKWATAAGGGGGALVPKIRTGSTANRWYSAGVITAQAPTSNVVTANHLRALPFVSPQAITVDRLAVECTNGVAGNLRMGIYSDDGNCYPASPLVDSGSISSNTTGVITATVSQALTAGTLYWLVFIASAAPTLRAMNMAQLTPILGWSSTIGNNIGVGWDASFTFAAFPTPFTAGGSAIVTGGVESVFIRGA
jgi:hypothetical protein